MSRHKPIAYCRSLISTTCARVLIVGAGIIGRSIAYYLSRAGAQPILIEAREGPSDASRASLGVLTHFSGGHSVYGLFIRDSHAVHRPLADELFDETGIDVGWRPLGGINLVTDSEDEALIKAQWDQARARSVPAERLSSEDIRRIEPSVASDVCWGLYFPEDQRVSPMRLGDALLKGAIARGAQIKYGESFLRIAESGKDRVLVETSKGRRSADCVVLASGAWTAFLAASFGAHVPVRPVRGEHGCYRGERLRHVLRHSGHQIIPTARGNMVGATAEEVGFIADTTEAGQRALHTVYTRLLAVSEPLRSQWAGLRAKPKAGRPMIGPLNEHPRIFIATGHYKNGVLMGPLTGQVIARWILEGQPGRDMQPFVPER